MTILKKVKIFIASTMVLFQGCNSPKIDQMFTDINPINAGIDFQNTIRETQHNNILKNEYTYNGGGVAVGDINNDGLVDIYLSGNMVSNKLYINKEDFEFENITVASKTGGRNDWATGVVMVDVNGDDWLDIYVCYSGNAKGEGYNLPVIKNLPNRANQLFINNGCKPGGVPTFTEKAQEFGLDAVGTFSTQSYFFDFDLDGDLDMFLLNHANTFYAPFINTDKLRNLRHPYFGNKLFRNDNMKFVEVSKEAGIYGSGLNFGLSAALTDIDMDGWPDMYVTNDYDEQDYCYINNQDGTFREVSHQILGHMSKSSMGSDIADVNNDGYADIFVADMLPEDNYRQKLLRGQDDYERYQLAVDSGFHHQFVRNTLQLNRGLAHDKLPRYSEIGQISGISNTDWSWSSLLVDLDNDGLRDVFITNGYLKDITNMDNMTRTSEVYKMAREKNVSVDHLMLIQDLPNTKLKNYVYQNIDGLQFENVSDKWGFQQKNVANGAAYADFDNDGDYDLVTNNLNQWISILRNNQKEVLDNSYLKIKLVGSDLNRNGIGAKIWIELGDRTIFQENYNARGYLSSSDLIQTFGIGSEKSIKSVKVAWPDGRVSTVENIKSNQLITVEYEESSIADEPGENLPNPTMLADITSQSGIDFRHEENGFNDYEMNRLFPYQLSRLGGKLAVADVNNDGNEDVFFGGASGQASVLYFANQDGTFKESKRQPWMGEAEKEDIDATFFDVDKDGDDDLYVVSGGNAFADNSPNYQDRLYLNDGTGNFSKAKNSIPSEVYRGSCAISADFDLDGDLDLFVGGRHLGSKYPYSPKSIFLSNESNGDKVIFANATAEVCSSGENIGMVTEAIWTDYNNDNWPDLIVVGEWMKITVFKNDKGKLVEQPIPALEQSNGMWTSIAAIDVDADGDMDYLMGNAGLNIQLKASPTTPLTIYAHDFNNDGKIDPILCNYIDGKSYPIHSRKELLGQVAALERKFTNYESYANATIEQVIDPQILDKTFKLNAYIMESCWLENDNGNFVLHKLPNEVQFSAVNSFLFHENDNGKKFIIAGGNFYPYKPEIGMLDASLGNILYYANSTLQVNQDKRSPLFLGGDIRDMALLSLHNGKKIIVVSRNDDFAGVYDINSTFDID